MQKAQKKWASGHFWKIKVGAKKPHYDDKKAVFRGLAWHFAYSGHFAHFFFLFNCDKKFINIYKLKIKVGKWVMT